MQVCVQASSREILQFGQNLGELSGATIEEVSDEVYAQILAKHMESGRGESLVLSPDHVNVEIIPPSGSMQNVYAAIDAEKQQFEELASLARSHPDPVVKALAARLGMV